MKKELSFLRFNELQLEPPSMPRGMLFKYYNPLPEKITYTVRPEATKLNNDYYPVFPTGKTLVTMGEYSVGGPIVNFDNGAIIGSGYQQNLIMLGVQNMASIGYQHYFSRKLTSTINLSTVKFSAPGYFTQSIGLSVMNNYKIDTKLTLNVFGSYEHDLRTKLALQNYGASLDMDIVGKWGVEGGVQTYYDNFSRRWETMPIVKPYFKLSEDCKLGIDFGPAIKQGIQNMIMKKSQNYGPTIPPPIPGR
jgi:hypothetical protein